MLSPSQSLQYQKESV
ncbi:hypothetical protein EYU62_23460, partial [Salmonella enterica subsp. enterica serovar Braenderup]|nr:hypothetical protein [Salmonella enterica subsp. enterica serovar Mbandaka]ECB5540135.1 hypothetical protein [Salmonella enterica subsp. enterica serovar Braenderup]EDA0816534.1 hypothetical protein [Salmonella enterica]EGI6664784.1 hypothetical protein [Salmonella enterica subsp. enterica serovar Rissen]MCV5348735.1 hypothetical protein [Escherichia coli]